MPKIYQIDSGYSHRFHAYVKNVVGVLGHIRACVMVEAGEGDSPHRNGLDGDKQPNVFANAPFNDNVAHQKTRPFYQSCEGTASRQVRLCCSQVRYNGG